MGGRTEIEKKLSEGCEDGKAERNKDDGGMMMQTVEEEIGKVDELRKRRQQKKTRRQKNKTVVGGKPQTELANTAFRKAEKRYRYLADQDDAERDYSDVFDFQNIEKNSELNLSKMRSIPIQDSSFEAIFKGEGFAELSALVTKPQQAFAIDGVDGLIILPNVFTLDQQLYWIRRSILQYTINNPTNLSNLAAGGSGGVEANSKSWPKLPEGGVDSQEMKELRWAGLGYTFQWGGRFYDENIKTPFPSDLSFVVQALAASVGFDKMKPEAAIVNFYRADKSAMGAHLDDAEEEMRVPIVSLSFGCSAIFLLGGLQRDEEPITPVLVRSGDVVIMSGRARYCYHGVPRIFSSTYPPSPLSPSLPSCSLRIPGEGEEQEGWRASDLAKFMKQTRININVRQVRKFGDEVVLNSNPKPVLLPSLFTPTPIPTTLSCMSAPSVVIIDHKVSSLL